jgi:hypothetical protein
VEQVQTAGDADELGDNGCVVDDDQQDHEDEGEAETELLADHVAEALAGDHAHAGAHFLYHDQGDGDGEHGPEQGVAELGASLGVSEDAAGVVIDVGGDESRTEHGEKQEYAGSPALPHAAWVLMGDSCASSKTLTGLGRGCEPGRADGFVE